MKRSLLELRKLRARVAELEGTGKEPIALIGLGCRFPGGAHDPDAFWKLLLTGQDAIVETPANRWDVSAYYDPDPTAPGKTYSRHGGFLEQVEEFDPHFFGISPREAASLDPQQRMLLEVSWEALEGAGLAPDRLYGTNAGVFIGISSFEYAARVIRSVDTTAIDPYFGTGSALSAAAGRLSFTLGLTGPSMAIDTACSSSLVALHLACQSLQGRECDLALAGGANLIVAPEVNIAFSKARLLAVDGRCKTFDAAADGYVRGEGCGVVVLKRLSDALANGDPIVALIRGSAVNQDGPSGALIVPNGLSQRSVIRAALKNAGVSAAQVDYVEAHGTGTSLGDPIEVGALGHVFGKERDPNHPLYLGSVKTNLGHLESAAGIAGLIKVALSLQHETIPANLHFHQPNPRIPWDLVSTVVPTRATPWPRGEKHRFAGLSSFGFTGTNAHVILEEAPLPKEASPGPDRPVHALTLSAKTDPALHALAARFEEQLASDVAVSIGDLCFSANTGRARFRERVAIVAGSIDELRGKLGDFVAGRECPGLFRSHHRKGVKDKTAFLFTGEGTEYLGMGRELYKSDRGFCETLNRCEQILRSHLERPLTEVLFHTDGAGSPINEPAYAQPALFSLEIALARLWQSWGIQPGAVLGCGVGGYAAAYVGGVLSLEDALELVAHRARLMTEAPTDVNALAVFADRLRKVNLSAPKIRWVSSVTGEVADQEIAAPEYWIRQTTQPPAKFADAIRTLHRLGCNRFVEIGPGPTLLGRGRECVPADSLTWIPSLCQGQSDWRQLVDGLALLSTQEPVVDWVAFDRGYPRRKVPLPTYPFQRQRFWLQPTRWQPTATPRDLYYRIDWQPEPAASDPAEASGLVIGGTWLIFTDRGGVGRELAEFLQTQGQECILIFPGAEYQRKAPLEWTINPLEVDQFLRLLREVQERGAPLRGAVHLWALDGTASESFTTEQLEAAALLGCGAAMHALQALAQNEFFEPLRFFQVTRGAQSVPSDTDVPGLAHATLWGLGKAINVEFPQLRCNLVDLDPAGGHEEEARLLFAELCRGNAARENFAVRAGRRYVSRLVRTQPPEPAPIALKQDRSYLITGGLGGIGLRIARWMAENSVRHVVLLARGEPSQDAAESIEEVRRLGAEVIVIRADVSRAHELAAALDRIRTSMPPLAGVIHCAGTFNDRLLVQHRWRLFAEVFAPKVLGSWNLHLLTRQLDLDFFVMFSSAASLLPTPGMSTYVAANAFQDELAHYRRHRNLPALSISWGPWESVGMAERAGRSRENQWRAHGMEPLLPSQALQALGLLLRESGHVGVFSLDWPKLLKLFSTVAVPPYLEKVASGRKEKAEAKESAIFRKLREMQPDERALVLESYLKEHITRLLGANAEALSNLDNLSEALVDSLMIMDVLNALRDDLKFMLYPREFYEQPTIQGLAKYLATEFDRAHGHSSQQVAAVPSVVAATTPDSQLRGLVETMAVNRFASDDVGERLPGIAFLLSSPRSGSTLLRVMLAGHPALFSPPELHLLPFSTMAERSRHLQTTHLGEGLQRALMELLNLDVEASRTMIEAWVEQDLPIREVYATLQKRAGSRLLVDKSPSHSAHRVILARAERLFKQARYIHLVRHPYAVIESFVRLRMDKLLGAEGLDPHFLAEEIWTTANRNILELVQTNASDRYHRVSYEELVRNPEPVLARCCEFLGVPFNEAVLKPYEGARMTQGIHAVSAPIDDPNFLNHDRIDARLGETWKEIDLGHRLNSSTREIARELGYELPRDPVLTIPIPNQPKASQSRMRALRGWDMEESYLESVRGLRLCLCAWGPKEGPPIVLLHGILEQGAAWVEVAQHLAEKGFRVLAPDLRGHGRSDHVGQGGSYYLLDFVADVDALSARLSDQQFTLVGHSMGSVIAALFAVARPDAVGSLVLVEPLLPGDRQADEETDREQLTTQLDYLAARARHHPLPDLEMAASRMRRALPGLSQELALKLAERNTRPGDGGFEWLWDPLLRTRAGISLGQAHFSRTRYLKLLQQLRAPLSIVLGNESEMRRNDGLLLEPSTLPGSELVVLPGGHNLHLEKPAALAEIIAKSASSATTTVRSQERATGT